MSDYSMSRKSTAEDVANFLVDWMNCYDSPQRRGITIGKKVLERHRTLQGYFVNVLLACLITMAEGDTDPRNETAIENCRRIKQMSEEGSIHFQMMI